MPHIAKTLALADKKPSSGYAYASSRRNPVNADCVMLCEREVQDYNCVGSACIEGSAGWLAFRNRKTGRYVFQYAPW